MPTDETARLAALRSYRILDTDPEAAFDDLTLLASQICGTPMAAISLIDDHRQWFKSKVGLSFNEVSRSVAFCTHAMGQQSVTDRAGRHSRTTASVTTRWSPASRTSGSTPGRR